MVAYFMPLIDHAAHYLGMSLHIAALHEESTLDVIVAQDYPTTFDFLKRAYGIGLPLTKLISHRFKLDEIAEALETNVQMKGIKIAVICG